MSKLDIPLFSLENLIDPYPAYKQVRDNEPVYFVQEMNLHVVTRYDLLREALKRTEDFSSKFDVFLAGAQQMAFNALPEDAQKKAQLIAEQMVFTPPTMLTLDEPEHTKYRSLVQRLFTVSQIRKSEPDVRRIVEKQIEAMRGKSELEFMGSFAFPIPLEIISDRLGIPEDDKEFFYKAATAAAAGLKMTPATPDEVIERMQYGVDLQQLLIKLIEARRIDPREDMISILANSKLEEENRFLTHGEALSVLNQFLVAGHETTTSTFGWGMLLLCQNPELQDQIRGNKQKIKVFTDEVLRMEAPVQGLPRVVTRDTKLGDYALKAGEMIMVRYGAANRDERQFENPDKVNLERSKAGLQMAFGSGVHHCIGAPLARQELSIGFYELMDKYQNFAIDEDKAAPVPIPSLLLRGLSHLHINFEARNDP